jgi:protein-S-isoprenylcysteine O-methyltransferase Ste14
VFEVSDVDDQVETKSFLEKMKLKITGVIGYLLPLVASMPPMFAWGGLMTVPFAVYLLMMLFNLVESPPIPNLLDPITLFATFIQLVAIAFLVWSIIHLRKKKSDGLVSSGPYRVVRHPQYLALIILTLLMAYQSIWILQHTFGIGWLSIEQTKVLWIGMLVAYAVIAKVEEMHLSNLFDSEWSEYRNRVGFLIPFLKHRLPLLEMLSGIIIPYAFLDILLYLTA